MRISIFSLASLVAYVGGLITAKEAIVNIFHDGIDFVFEMFSISGSHVGEYKWVLDWSLVSMFVIIGCRFYWHAQHIDSHKTFYREIKDNNKKTKYLDFLLRTIWIIISLSFPIVCSNNIVDGYLRTVVLLSCMFCVMYLCLYVWSQLFLDSLLKTSVSLGPEQKWLLTLFDNLTFAAFFFVPLFSYGLVKLGNIEDKILYVAFMLPALFATICTIFQLIVFVPLYVANRPQRFKELLKKFLVF